MPKFRKKPIEIEAHQWCMNGDHPEDRAGDPNSGYPLLTEGRVVRFYRHPPVNPTTGEVSASDDAILLGKLRHCDTPERFRRATCQHLMDDHGWIDTLEGGHTVCPADWIITGIQGERYPCKPDIFEATYDAVNDD